MSGLLDVSISIDRCDGYDNEPCIGAMDLYNGGTSDGTEIVGWQYGGFGGHQLWCIRPVGYFPAHGTIVK